MASFDVSTPAGLGKFNGHLADKSYINGFLPSQDDVKIFNEVSQALPQGPEEKFVHAYRWFKHIKSFSEEEKAAFGAGGASSSAAAAEAPAAEDDDFDVFGETSAEEEEAERKRREAEAAAKKKPAIVQKSNIILDVKPWDDETDLAKLEESVRSIEMEGLKWGPSKLVEVAYGVKKLQISCVVVDDLVSTDDLEERITAFDEYVQSMDIAAFTKV